MRIVHVVPTYLPAVRYGGTIHAVHGLCRALAADGHVVEVFTTNVDGDRTSSVPLYEPVDVDGVVVRYFPVALSRRLYLSPTLARALRPALAAADVAHLHSVFLWPTARAARLSHAAATPYIVSPHGMLDPVLIAARGRWRKRAWIALFERRTLREADVLHVTSAQEARGLAQLRLDLAPVAQIPNGVDTGIEAAGAADAPAVAARRRRVLYVGRLSWKKGVDVLIDAIALLRDVDVVIAGPNEGDEGRRLRQRVAAAGLDARVQFLGLIAPNARDRLMRECAVLVLPSRSENFALVVAEAMANGCPVVVSPAVGIAEDVARAGAGTVCQAQAAPLAAAMRAILDDPAGAARMGRAGALLARESYAWPRIAARMAELYARVADAPRRGLAGAPTNA